MILEKAASLGSIYYNSTDLEKMSGGDELMSKVIDVVHRIADDFEMRFYYDEEEVKRLEFQAGIEKGIEQSTINIAKNMLSINYDVNFISDITNLSIEDIQKLKEELE